MSEQKVNHGPSGIYLTMDEYEIYGLLYGLELTRAMLLGRKLKEER